MSLDNLQIQQPTEGIVNKTIEFSPHFNQIRNFLRGMTSFSLDGQPLSFTLTDRNLTTSDKEVAELLKGKRVVDLGCGDKNSTIPLRRFAKICGATEYLGVDLTPTPSPDNYNILPTTWVKSDILDYLTTQQATNDTVFILSGIDAQPSEQSDTYFINISRELERISGPRTIIIIGPYTHELNLEKTFEIIHNYRDVNSSTETKILRPRM